VQLGWSRFRGREKPQIWYKAASRFSRLRLFRQFVLVALFAASALAQRAEDFALQTKHADVVCAATVTSIEAPTQQRNTYLIRFRVDEALRGTQTAAEITVTEWAGRWEQGTPRYRVGERYLLFVSTAKGAASVVAGENGRLKIEKDDTVSVPSRAGRAKRLRSDTKASRIPYAEAVSAIRSAIRERE
jgi:hypothetical protein